MYKWANAVRNVGFIVFIASGVLTLVAKVADINEVILPIFMVLVISAVAAQVGDYFRISAKSGRNPISLWQPAWLGFIIGCVSLIAFLALAIFGLISGQYATTGMIVSVTVIFISAAASGLGMER